MIAIISSILGVFSGIIPNIVKLLERRQDYKYELELTKLKIEAANRGLELNSIAETAKADVEEGKSLRQHDSNIATNVYLETLRASVRPVLTYFFFFLFCGIKIAAAALMFQQNANPVEILNAVWDTYTVAIFGAIMGFWFGQRAMEKISNINTRTVIPQIQAQPQRRQK